MNGRSAMAPAASLPAASRPIEPLCPHPSGGWWSRGWHLLFYGTLGFGLLEAVTSAEVRDDTARFMGIVVITGALAAWYWTWVVRDGDRLLASPRASASYFAVAGALWAILVVLAPAYEVVAFSAFMQATGYLTWRKAVPALAVVFGIMVLHPLVRGNTLGLADLTAAGITAAVLSMIVVSMRAIHQESHRRQRLIEELQDTRADLAITQRHAGMLEERERLAGEIHDTVAQGLSSIVMLLEAAQVTPSALAPGARGHIEQALQTARDNLKEVRRLVWALRPESLEKGTLPDAVSRLVENLRRESGLKAQAVVNGSQNRLATDIEVTLLRATQELLSNIRRHALASEATITLSYLDDAVHLEVLDNGGGFDPEGLASAPDRDGGLGLVVLRERVEALGGSLGVDSSPHRGTKIRIRLPLRPILSRKVDQTPISAP
jgi:signal transduction histidine kinase